VVFVHRHHERAHAHVVVPSFAKLLRRVVHGVELSDLVVETDSVKQGLDGFTRSRELEIVLSNAELGESGREEEIHSLGLVTVVLVVSDRLLRLEGDVGSDGRATKGAVDVLTLANLVGAIVLD